MTIYAALIVEVFENGCTSFIRSFQRVYQQNVDNYVEKNGIIHGVIHKAHGKSLQ